MAELYLKVVQQKPNAKVLFISNKAKIASLNGSLVDYSKFSLKDGRFLVDPAYAKELGITSYKGNLRSSSLQANGLTQRKWEFSCSHDKHAYTPPTLAIRTSHSPHLPPCTCNHGSRGQALSYLRNRSFSH